MDAQKKSLVKVIYKLYQFEHHLVNWTCCPTALSRNCKELLASINLPQPCDTLRGKFNNLHVALTKNILDIANEHLNYVLLETKNSLKNFVDLTSRDVFDALLITKRWIRRSYRRKAKMELFNVLIQILKSFNSNWDVFYEDNQFKRPFENHVAFPDRPFPTKTKDSSTQTGADSDLLVPAGPKSTVTTPPPTTGEKRKERSPATPPDNSSKRPNVENSDLNELVANLSDSDSTMNSIPIGTEEAIGTDMDSSDSDVTLTSDSEPATRIPNLSVNSDIGLPDSLDAASSFKPGSSSTQASPPGHRTSPKGQNGFRSKQKQQVFRHVTLSDSGSKHWHLPQLEKDTCLILGASNTGRIPAHILPKDWQVHSFPGARFTHFESIIKQYIGPKPKLVLICAGYNDRSNSKCTNEQRLASLLLAIKDKFGVTRVKFASLNFDLKLFNQVEQNDIKNHCDLIKTKVTSRGIKVIPPLDHKLFEVDPLDQRHRIHWTTNCAEAMFHHWLNHLN